MQKVLLLILDGWGVSDKVAGNAMKTAKLAFYNKLLKTCPNTLLNASGVFVGLPRGIMGNSEVGHENIGAGRINKQKLTMISDMIQSGEFFQNKVLLEAIQHALKNKSKLQLMGLISEGDVHAHLGHLDALIELAERMQIDRSKLFLHAISDGRDDPPRVAEHLMKRYETKINIATVSGRYWAMDRDNNWDRIEKYFNCITQGQGFKSKSASQAILDAYALAEAGKNPAGTSDEFVLPTVINAGGLIGDSDSVIFFNFRPDRARQISKRLGMNSGIHQLQYTCFTDYGGEVNLPIAFTEDTLPKQSKAKSLGEIVSKAGFRQFRIAETEKYNHVTSFFNQGAKEAFPNEDRLLIPSPKVATYDLQPEMSIYAVRDKLIEAITDKEKDYKLIVCNFANPDMVGHTGVWIAVIKALEAVDQVLHSVIDKAKQESYVIMVTADHGNADQMLEDDGSVRTAHSCNPVPFIVINSQKSINLKAPYSDENNLDKSLSLSNIAPTILEYLDLAKPEEMSASSLLKDSLELF
jgi:2,3-bisphosphoglycerate-independent phosphoglycerate mutase